MTTIATDQQDVAHNRRLALRALAAIGRHLDGSTRERHLAIALAAARGEYDGGFDDEIFSNDPLNRFRFAMGPTTLRDAGVAAAARLAHTPEQYSDVVAIAQSLMPHADPPSANTIAQALAQMPPDQFELDIPMLAAHSSEWIRAAAAALWCTGSRHLLDIGRRLATDPSPRVRRALANHLPQSAVCAYLRATLRGDARRSVRSVLSNAAIWVSSSA